MLGNLSSIHYEFKFKLIAQLRSNALSTKGQALDHIIDLSLDHHVRGLLKAVGAVRLIGLAHEELKELFVQSDHRAFLFSRYRNALASIADDKFMQVIKDLDKSNAARFFNQAFSVWSYVRYVNNFLPSRTVTL